MTPQQIMERARELHEVAQTAMSLSVARRAAVTAAALIYHLAKLHLPENERKKTRKKLSMPKSLEPKKNEFTF